MKIKRETFVRFEVASLIFLIIIVPVGFVLSDTTDQGHRLEDEDDTYRVYIEASLWKYKVYDLNNLGMSALEFSNMDDDILKSEKVLEGRFSVDTSKQFAVYLTSRDLDHTIFFEELDLYLEAPKPDIGIEFGDVVDDEVTLPFEDTFVEGRPRHDVGIGTEDMKVELLVGDPLRGINVLLATTIGLLTAVFIYYLYTIYHGTNILDRGKKNSESQDAEAD